MKKAIIRRERQGGVIEVADPQPSGDWVVVKVQTAPMCTEYKAFVEGRTSEYLGHEAAGEVVAVAQPGRVQAGDRVVVMPQNPCGCCALCLAGDYIHCQQTVDFAAFHGTREGSATMAQYLLKQDWLLVPLPDAVSYDHGAMACCGLGPTFGAFEKMHVDRFDTVLITGLGPVGLGGVINAVYRGARVIGVDTNPYRKSLALELGADAVFEPTEALEQISKLTKGSGVDKAVDCSGVVAAHRLCIDATRRLGKIAFVGESQAETPLVISPDMIRKGLTLIGSWHYKLKDTLTLMRIIQDVGPQLEQLITHRFALDDVQLAWETQVGGNCGKVLLKPWN